MLFLLAILLLMPADLGAADSGDVEYKLKAEMMERFTRFIEWPDNGSSSPFLIGVIGKNPFGDHLRYVFENVKISGKKVEIHQLTSADETGNCQIVFISRSEQTNLPVILTNTSRKPILTIADSDGFAAKGVLINFYPSGGYVRFEINQKAGDASGLKFSSRLMKLARIVETQKP